MPDRGYGPVTLWLPESGPVTVTSPTGRTVLNGTATDVGVPGRYRLDITLPLPEEDGEWMVTLPSGRPFTIFVGTPQPSQARAIDAFLDLATRVGEGYLGTATTGSATSVSDPALFPKEGHYLVRAAGPEIGLGRRVEDGLPGQASWSQPFATPLAAGEPYLLVRLNPERGWAALELACRALSRSTRVTVVAKGLSLDETEGTVTVPRGWKAVYDVWLRLDSGEARRVTPNRWEMRPGRLLLVKDPLRSRAVAVDLYGYRDGAPPRFWDSFLDRDSQTVVALAQLELSLSGAGAVVIDPEDRLRKAALSLQEQNMLVALRGYRVPGNAKLVIT